MSSFGLIKDGVDHETHGVKRAHEVGAESVVGKQKVLADRGRVGIGTRGEIKLAQPNLGFYVSKKWEESKG